MKSSLPKLLVAFVCTGAGLLALAAESSRAHPGPAYRLELAGPDEPARFVKLVTEGEAPPVVSQKEKTFAPGTVTLRVGQALEISNDDTTVHNAYCQSGGFKYNSGPQQPGSKSVVTFTTAGLYEIRCAIHPKMRLTVTVTE